MSEPVIVLDNVNKSYPVYHHLIGFKNFILNLPGAIRSFKRASYEVFHSISFEVRNGETLGIIGRNGTGKSTILGLIAGVLKPSSGRVVVKKRVTPILELGAGFHHELTGRENIVLNGVLLGCLKKVAEERLDEIVEFSELGEFIDQPIKTYSSGMLARLAFSVVISLDPEILLIDEVLAVGDKDFQKKCLERMMELKKKGVTMVFVSHAMEDVKRICDRVIWIEDHKIKMEGEPERVISSYLSS